MHLFQDRNTEKYEKETDRLKPPNTKLSVIKIVWTCIQPHTYSTTHWSTKC